MDKHAVLTVIDDGLGNCVSQGARLSVMRVTRVELAQAVLLLGGLAGACQTQDADLPSSHGEEPCWSCESAENADHLNYSAVDVAAAVEGLWSGEFDAQDGFGALTLTVDIQLEEPMYSKLAQTPASCDVPDSAVENCAGIHFSKSAVLTTDNDDWNEHNPSDGEVTVLGTNLDCPTPSLSGCPFVSFEASVDGDGQGMTLVFTNDDKLWVKFENVSSTDFVEIGKKK